MAADKIIIIKNAPGTDSAEIGPQDESSLASVVIKGPPGAPGLPGAGLESGIITPGTYGPTVSTITVDTYGRVTAVTDIDFPTKVIYWPQSTPWSAIVAQFAASPAQNEIQLVDDKTAGTGSPVTAGDWVINAPANLDNVYLRGLGTGYPKNVEITSGFQHTGAVGFIRAQDVLLTPTGTVTATAQRLFIVLYNAAINNFLNSASTPFFVVVSGHSTAATISGSSSLVGKDATSPLFAIPNGAGSNLVLNATGGGQFGQFTAGMVSGTATINVVSDAIQQAGATAFGAGITVVKQPRGDAFYGAYAPTTPANWIPAPNNVGTALDQLAGRTHTIYWPQSTPWSTIVAQLDADQSHYNYIQLVDDNTAGAGSPAVAGNWIIDANANLDNVWITGPAFGMIRQLEIADGFVQTGSIGYLRFRKVSVAARGTITTTAQSLLVILDEANLGNPNSTKPFFTSVLGHSPTLVLYNSSYFYGNGSVPLIAIPNGGGATVFFVAGSRFTSSSFGMVSGTGTLTVFGDPSGYFTSNAVGAGIAVTKIPFGDAFFGGYTPTAPGNWTPAPTSVGSALDTLAAQTHAIYWGQATAWSTIKARINTSAVINIIYLVDDGSGPATYTIDSPANLDNVLFRGWYKGSRHSSLTFTSGFDHTGPVGRLLFEDTFITTTGTFTATGSSGGLSIQMRNASWGASVSAPAFTMGAYLVATLDGNGSNLSGWDSTHPLFLVPNGSQPNFSLTGGALLSAYVVGPSSGTATLLLAVDATTRIFNNAVLAGITISKNPIIGDCFNLPYAPTTPANWASVPATVGAALDTITGTPAFTTPTLLNSWSAATPIGYVKDAMGFVHFKGGALNGGGATTNPIFQLPAGFRRSALSGFACAVPGGTVAQVNIDTSGNVFCASAQSFISLDGITFYADA